MPLIFHIIPPKAFPQIREHLPLPLVKFQLIGMIHNIAPEGGKALDPKLAHGVSEPKEEPIYRRTCLGTKEINQLW